MLDGVTGRRQPSVGVGCGRPQSDGVYDRSQDSSCFSIIGGRPSSIVAGIDVSLESANVCVVDASGRIVCEAKVASEPDVLIRWFGHLDERTRGEQAVYGEFASWLMLGLVCPTMWRNWQAALLWD